MNITRNEVLDTIRGIALVCIIIAHSNPSELIFQIRNFDVVLMVFISGTLYDRKYSISIETYIKYIVKRVKRLVYPTWLFLSVFFICTYSIWSFTLKEMLLSYTFVSGIGFVWIFRVFIFVSILLPVFVYFDENKFYGLVGLVSLYFLLSMIPLDNKIVNYAIIQPLGYTFVAYLAYKFKGSILKPSNNFNIALVTFGFLLFILLAFNYFSISIQDYKYPPKFYYLLYGTTMSILIFNLIRTRIVFLSYLGRNSMWIYLWHIPFVIIMQATSISFIYKVIIISSLAIAIVSLQSYIVNKFIKNTLLKQYLLG